MKSFIVLLICLSLTSLALPQNLHILYTQNTNGVLDNCNCPSMPLGGMEKRATFLSQFRAQHANTLLFDSGDFFKFSENQEIDAKIAQAMHMLEYDAVNIGDQEFSDGGQFFNEAFRTHSLPLISTNLIWTRQMPEFVRPFRTIEIEGMNILVLGALNAKGYNFYQRVYDDIEMKLVPAENALIDIYQQQSSMNKYDLVILLSNLGLDEEQRLAESLDFLDIILGGHSQHQLEEPLIVNNTLIAQCGKNGQYIGHLEIHMNEGKLTSHKNTLIPMELSIADDESMLKLINE
ncbi:MAG: hypothetical protein K9N35_04970 [Candidatus Marinimicrobia bacterium]|nr:hypothetical protein [Candidatus Neomarinimicrobiota bacterium]